MSVGKADTSGCQYPYAKLTLPNVNIRRRHFRILVSVDKVVTSGYQYP